MQGAWSWTILKAETYTFLLTEKGQAGSTDSACPFFFYDGIFEMALLWFTLRLGRSLLQCGRVRLGSQSRQQRISIRRCGGIVPQQ